MSTRTRTYQPGTAVIDPTAPGGIDALLAYHRATFGDARMEAGAGDDDADEEGGTSTPSENGDSGAEKAAGTRSAGNGASGSDNGTSGGDSEGDLGYPPNTPVREMTPEQQVAYWKRQARRHEARAEQQRQAAMSAEERALEQARQQAREEARAEARREYAPQLVRAEFRAAAAGTPLAEHLDTLLEPLDLHKFLTPEGEVATDKVKQYVAGLAPGGKAWPDMGQGRRGTHQQPKGVNAGRDLYEARRGKSKK